MHDAPWNQTTFIHVLCISLGTGNPPRPVETVQIRDITMESRSESSGGNSKSPAPESSLSSWFLGFFNRVAATDGTYTRQQEGVVLSDLPPISQIFHPGELINNYILKKVPEARVVMSHDDDWSEILGDDDPGSQIQTISELLQRISDQYEIVEKDGANFLHPMSLADAVQQNHAGWSKWPKNQPEQGGPQWAFNESNSFHRAISSSRTAQQAVIWLEQT
ncbi:hypothetical protein B0H14DRAFT_1664465 [Mycena olivaceomarginata]|nr:hypothetical protein B0H14DRAFT_1664465 [Mycena olivaceomarginata]